MVACPGGVPEGIWMKMGAKHPVFAKNTYENLNMCWPHDTTPPHIVVMGCTSAICVGPGLLGVPGMYNRSITSVCGVGHPMGAWLFAKAISCDMCCTGGTRVQQAVVTPRGGPICIFHDSICVVVTRNGRCISVGGLAHPLCACLHASITAHMCCPGDIYAQ